jgi:hypothetical protein
MRFKTLRGKEVFKNIEKYRIDWDGKSLSKFQFGVKQFLKKYWKDQVCFEEMPVTGTRMRIDIYNANKRVAVEIDGVQHEKFSEFYHNGDRGNFLKQINRDAEKYKWCEINEITLINIKPSDLPLTKKFFEKQGVFL